MTPASGQRLRRGLIDWLKFKKIKWIEVVMQSSVPIAEVSESVSGGDVRVADGVAGKRAKVMVIDDSKTIRRTAETLLKKEGFEVIIATDGFEALSMIADHQPDLILLDIMMPRLDGYQTCALIKHHRVFRHTPVIMLSSKDGLFDRARGRVVGSDNYITKPFTREELLTVIEQHTENTD
jgi:twitching motility two-component system response regulator PilG